jgi:ribosome-associated protein
MRTLEPAEVAVIQTAIDSWHGSSKSETAALHSIERQRERLLADDNALTALREKHPELDIQHVRNLIRNARKEQAEQKPPKAYREIFQLLKGLKKSTSDSQNADHPHEHDDEEDA